MLIPLSGVGLMPHGDLTVACTVFMVAAAGILGLLIGSFLNVVIVRVPVGRSVVLPGSTCVCGEPIAPRDNVPVLSWVRLRGRARCCGAAISGRYPLVEAATAVAFGVVSAWVGLSWLLPAMLYLAAISIALAVIDLELHRLPDRIVLPSYPVAAGLLTLAALAVGEPGRLLSAALSAAALFGLYFALIAISPAGMGFGDVKLSGVLGLYLGFFGWQYAVVGAFLGFLAGGVGGVAMMVIGSAGLKSKIPYGPYMLIGAWLALVAGGAMAHWYLERSGLS